MGCIGKDEFGQEMIKACSADGVNVSDTQGRVLLSFTQELRKMRYISLFLRGEAVLVHVQVHYMEDEEHPTGTCAVLVCRGERLVPIFDFSFPHLPTSLSFF